MGGAVTRCWPAGLPVAVEQDTLAAPQTVAWAGRRHRVATILERWRIDEGWWRRRVWREVFVLLTTSGLLLELVHDLRGNSWYLQRLYD